MESRKDLLNSIRLCRFCLSQESLTSLYDSNVEGNIVPLKLKILSCISVEVYPSDKMPSFICSRCKFFMEMCYEFKEICHKADGNIFQYIQNGASLKSIAWPPLLSKLWSREHEPKVVMKTIVEGGATIQVSTQEVSDDDEEDDENVYSVKIEDDSDEGAKSARIKLITHDKQETTKISNHSQKDSGAERGRPPREGCWACDVCDCTYPLQQLLRIHQMQKHRTRTVQCDQCDDKFFSKYNLMIHQLRHSSETPFQCIACDKKFKRLVLLKRHEKLIHSDLPQLQCTNCPASFLSHEELEAHQTRHPFLNRRYACDICGKKFLENATLLRHKDMVHNKNPTFSCEYCPQRFSTLSKLAKHVRTHAGERAYPCKFCNKSFMKSHHYTRHLRLKHRETVRTARGPFGEAEQFRCEQCGDSFAAQDDFIYHSAIHATQNLTCPLCQERFLNVDDVTAHIKSHVTGTEFMCDYCELVFTSKDKLESHLVDSHEDEMRNSELGQDESSMEVEADVEEDDDNDLNVKEDGDQMIVEINKPDNFMLPTTHDEIEDKDQSSNPEDKDDKVIELEMRAAGNAVSSHSQDEAENKTPSVNSEESESEVTYTELSTVETLTAVKRQPAKVEEPPPKPPAAVAKQDADISLNAPILKKAEEIKRKVIEKPAMEPADKSKERVNSKVESGNSVGASDKSLRLLEKELQELKRTNPQTASRNETVKSVTMLRNKRPQIHTSTPKASRAVEERKSQAASRSPVPGAERRGERRLPKENKEPADDKDTKTSDMAKSAVKNGANDKSNSEEGIRRSTRPSKIKDYAKMIRDSSQESNDDDSDVDDEEYKEEEKSPELIRSKPRRSSVKPVAKTATPVATPPAVPKKRGRPRKEQGLKKPELGEPDAKVVKNSSQNGNTPKANATKTAEKVSQDKTVALDKKDTENNATEPSKATTTEPKPGNMLVSPTGQTLKKVPIKALPPGVKPLPLPASARQMGGEVCEMQIGKKMVKVQKIVMTKAEVEAMAKKGLVEMKDGTMVLKQGIKIPSADASTLKSLVGEEAGKESLSRKEKGTPMRCEMEDDS